MTNCSQNGKVISDKTKLKIPFFGSIPPTSLPCSSDLLARVTRRVTMGLTGSETRFRLSSGTGGLRKVRVNYFRLSSNCFCWFSQKHRLCNETRIVYQFYI